MPRLAFSSKALEDDETISAVDQLHNEQKAKDSGLDTESLYKGTQDYFRKKAEEEKPENPDDAEGTSDSDLENIVDNTEMPPENGDDPSEEPEEKHFGDAVNEEDKKTATEDFSSMLTSTKELSWDGLVYLKDVGIEYGPTVFKHIFRGTFFALVGIAKALVKGTTLLVEYAGRKINSFTNLRGKLTDVQAALEVVKENHGVCEKDLMFTNSKSLARLKIGSSINLKENLSISMKFIEDFFKLADMRSQAILQSVQKIMTDVSNGSVAMPSHYTSEGLGFQGFNRAHVDGYSPPDQTVESYCYHAILAGDAIFVGYAPKANLEHEEELIEAISHSKLFIGIASTSETVVMGCKVLSIEELMEITELLIKLCDICLKREKAFTGIAKLRNMIKISLQSYVKFILFSKNRLNDHETLSNLVYAKMKFLDQTYIGGELMMHDYAIRLINASLSYLSYSVKSYK